MNAVVAVVIHRSSRNCSRGNSRGSSGCGSLIFIYGSGGSSQTNERSSGVVVRLVNVVVGVVVRLLEVVVRVVVRLV